MFEKNYSSLQPIVWETQMIPHNQQGTGNKFTPIHVSVILSFTEFNKFSSH